MDDKMGNLIILGPMGVNILLGIINRVLQIIYYCMNKYGDKEKYGFKEDEVRNAALTFCILPTAVSAFMMFFFLILHYEEMLTPIVKIKNFFLFIISIEILFPIGVHKSLSTKYTYSSDNPIITMRFVNAIHFMLVALPQLLIVSINSSYNEKFNPVDIASLVFSIIFMIWSVAYYVICIFYNQQFDEYMTECVYKLSTDKKNE